MSIAATVAIVAISAVASACAKNSDKIAELFILAFGPRDYPRSTVIKAQRDFVNRTLNMGAM